MTAPGQPLGGLGPRIGSQYNGHVDTRLQEDLNAVLPTSQKLKVGAAIREYWQPARRKTALEPNRMRYALAVILTLAQTLLACPCANVQLIVSDPFGNPVPIKSLQFTSDGHDVANQFRDGRAKLVPYGRYAVTVLVPGFELWRGDVQVENANVVVPIGMQLGGIEGAPRSCRLQGRVLEGGGRIAAPAWVRVQAVFGSQGSATALQADHFGFENLPCGKYLITVISGPNVIGIASTILTRSHESVEIPVSEPHGSGQRMQ